MLRHVAVKGREQFQQQKKHIQAHGIGDNDSQFTDCLAARIE